MTEEKQNQENNTNTEREKKDVSYYFDFSEVLGYFFRKKDPNSKPNFNLRMMHGINKISILMFLFAVIVMIVRFISRS